MMNIYDCFQYFDEDLLLDIRLNVLNQYVKNLTLVHGSAVNVDNLAAAHVALEVLAGQSLSSGQEMPRWKNQACLGVRFFAYRLQASRRRSFGQVFKLIS